MAGKVTWVRLDSNRQRLTCDRCGRWRRLRLPAAPLDYAIAVDSFMARHGGCPVKRKPKAACKRKP